ncbi:MAG: TIGR03087 family PEP-CTERM/XrtA system glycosyltransferase [Alteraurantiacibacter sp.]
MSEREILFLAHRMPFPPDRGDRIRSAHVLKALAQLAPVHVGAFVDDAADLLHLPELARVATSHRVEIRRKPLWRAGAEALLAGEPVSLAAWRSASLSRWVDGLLASGRIATVFLYSGQMGQFVPADWSGRLVVDLCDVDSAKFEAYAAEAGPGRGLVHAREGRLLKRVEAELAARADHTLLASEEEAALLRSRAAGGRDIRALRNGIDAAFFSPAGVIPASVMPPTGPRLLFTGQMDYPPNVAAARRMARQIMPLVLERHPQASCHIVGRAPTPEVLALEGVNRTCVHGAVPDVRPYLAAADVVAVPLDIARGVQNKVLEAMAMARPTVVSPAAATGIEGRDGEHFLIAGDDAAFAAAIGRVLANPGTFGPAARDYVLANQSWPAMLADLPRLVGLNGEGQRDAA